MSTAVEAQLDQGGWKLYAAAIEQDSVLYGEHVVDAATGQVCKRYDTFLTRRYREHRDPPRRSLVISELRYRCHAPPKDIRQPLQTSPRLGGDFAGDSSVYFQREYPATSGEIVMATLARFGT